MKDCDGPGIDESWSSGFDLGESVPFQGSTPTPIHAIVVSVVIHHHHPSPPPNSLFFDLAILNRMEP